MKHLIIGDIHGNLPALEAVLAEESDWDSVIFLGDAVDSGPHPNQVLTRLANLSGTFLMGNHDSEITESKDKDPPTPREYTKWTNNVISEENRSLIRSFIPDTVLSFPDAELGDMRVHHGDFTIEDSDIDWNGRLWPDSDSEIFELLSDRYDEPIVVFGHSHVQFERYKDGTRFINPGSVGQHRLQTVKACYAVLEDGIFDLKAVEYDAEKAVKALHELPLGDALIKERSQIYTDGILTIDLRDFTSLREAGYR
ncbi:metallophosphoesterase family protein [Natrarchaeobius chitinivorans]|uniref:Metallophosphoesterase n=1 Tax=Natrarchaeobius chitinivorans TaxID=1679083 RepID=A0A3N6LTS1_NATCH|nr:metallophosphoesterase family protein [Natrarchaeobius chitinivorans]RQG93523.1 metallophosphoesterase [Natrarchaeobius chitinivorans]